MESTRRRRWPISPFTNKPTELIALPGAAGSRNTLTATKPKFSRRPTRPSTHCGEPWTRCTAPRSTPKSSLWSAGTGLPQAARLLPFATGLPLAAGSLLRCRSVCPLLLALQPLNKHGQKTLRIRTQDHPRIRLQDFVTLDFIVIPMQHVFLICAQAVRHRFPSCVVALRLHIHMHFLPLHQRRINHHSDRERVIHGRPVPTILLRPFDIKFRDSRNHIVLRSMTRLEFP